MDNEHFIANEKIRQVLQIIAVIIGTISAVAIIVSWFL